MGDSLQWVDSISGFSARGEGGPATCIEHLVSFSGQIRTTRGSEYAPFVLFGFSHATMGVDAFKA